MQIKLYTKLLLDNVDSKYSIKIYKLNDIELFSTNAYLETVLLQNLSTK